MRALVLAAGLGTRLKPWTLYHPKALVPVAGVPMLERVLSKLEREGFDRIVVNIHHFGDQIEAFLKKRNSQATILISDEREQLLDTGGGILQADALLGGDGPLLVHNTDILSNAPLRRLIEGHKANEADATLLTSNRESSRKLAFDDNGALRAWTNLRTGEVKPKEAEDVMARCSLHAFSGIYVLSPTAIKDMREQATKRVFPIMDYFMAGCDHMNFKEFYMPELKLLDIGKPEALSRAEDFIAVDDQRRPF